MSFVRRDPARSHERKMPRNKKSASDWVQGQNFRTPKTLKLRPVQHITRTAEANKKRRARLELSEENLDTSGEDDVTFSQDRENEPSPPHRRSFTGDISLDSNQNRNEAIVTITKNRNMKGGQMCQSLAYNFIHYCIGVNKDGFYSNKCLKLESKV